MATLERTRSAGTRPYALRSRIRCGICTRKMQAATIRGQVTYYRCLARTLAPGSVALADHPRTVNLREDVLLEPLNAWLGDLFSRDNLDRTVATLVASQAEHGHRDTREAVKKRLRDAETRLRRLQAAIESGIDPVALVEAVNAAQAQRAAARAQLAGTPDPGGLTAAEIHAMIDSLGNVGAALSSGRPESLSKLYESLGLELCYQPQERAVEVTASPRVVSECVRGATCTLTTRLALAQGR